MKRRRRFLSLFLAFMLCSALFPETASAEASETGPVQESIDINNHNDTEEKVQSGETADVSLTEEAESSIEPDKISTAENAGSGEDQLTSETDDPLKNSTMTYYLTYNANGGAGEPDRQSGNGWITISSTVPQRFGYDFLGWSTEAAAEGYSYFPSTSYNLTSNATLYACWENAREINYNIMYAPMQFNIFYWHQKRLLKYTPDYDCSIRFESTGTDDTYATLYNGEGVKLTSNDDGGDEDNFRIDYDLTAGTTYYLELGYYATESKTGVIDLKVWRTYKVSYDFNGGSGNISMQRKLGTTPLTLSTETPGKYYGVTYNANGGTCSTASEPAYCTFNSWNTRADGTGTSYAKGGSYEGYEDVTLYAQYSDPTYGTLPTPTRNGYTFAGWYTAASGGTKVTASTVVTSDITLYAHWTADTVKITKQPSDVTAEAGKTASFSVTATGSGLTYQWQYSTNGTTWVSSSASSAKTATLSTTASTSYSGRLYRCIVKDSNGKSVTSSSAKLTVTSATTLKITKQPANVSTTAGKTVTFSVTATGSGLAYQWQYSTNGSTWYSSSAASAKTATLSTTVQSSFNGRLYRCIVKDSSGNSVTSSSAKLTVTAATPTISVSGTGTTRTITVKNASSYADMRAAVWSTTSDQDDLTWNTMTKQSDGSWSVTISTSCLKHTGTINVHVYTGTSTLVGTTTFTY